MTLYAPAAEQDPFAVTGDFNAHPDRPPIQFLTGEAPLQGTARRLGRCLGGRCTQRKPGYTSNPWKAVGNALTMPLCLAAS